MNREEFTLKNVLKFIAITFMIAAIAITIIGLTAIAYKNTVGVLDKDADRNQYKHSKSYIEGMIKDLADYKYQHETAKNETEKQALKNRIINDFANFDSGKIKEEKLRIFLKEMRGF